MIPMVRWASGTRTPSPSRTTREPRSQVEWHARGAGRGVRGPPAWLDMHFACEYALHMSKMIQLRNVPDVLHRRLKARAALEGMSLSEYLIAEVRRAGERPSVSELRQRLAQRSRVKPSISPAQALREEREAR